MTFLRRLELLGGVATAAAGLTALVYTAVSLAGIGDVCVTQGSFTSCHPASASVVLATLMFTPILLGVLGFTLNHTVGRVRGSLPFLWLFALLLAAAAGVALLPLVVVARQSDLPSGYPFLPSVALGLATVLLATLARGPSASMPAQSPADGASIA